MPSCNFRCCYSRAVGMRDTYGDGVAGGAMKCSIHTEADAVGVCVHCGRAVCSTCSTTVSGKTCCNTCAANCPGVVIRKQTGKPIAGGILGIIAGVILFFTGSVFIAGGAAVDYSWESAGWAEIGTGIALVVLAILAVVGSSFAIFRRNFGLSVLGGICALPFWLLGIPALILIAMSRDEFINASTSWICIGCGRENPKGSGFCSGCGRELLSPKT
jgi:hypothetical protein